MTECGDETTVVLSSLVMTAKANGIDPIAFIRDLLLRVSTKADVPKLTPHGWKENFADEVAEQGRAAAAYFAGA